MYLNQHISIHFFIFTVAPVFASAADHVVANIRARAQLNAADNGVMGYFRAAGHVVVIHNEMNLLFVSKKICSKEVRLS